MDKRAEELFERLFDKVDRLSVAIARNGELANSHSDDIKYIRDRTDSISSVVSSNSAKIDNHLSGHLSNPGKIGAWATVGCMAVSACALLISIYSSMNKPIDKYYYKQKIDRIDNRYGGDLTEEKM